MPHYLAAFYSTGIQLRGVRRRNGGSALEIHYLNFEWCICAKANNIFVNIKQIK